MIRVHMTVSNYDCMCGVCKDFTQTYESIEEAQKALKEFKETGYPYSYGFILSEDDRIVGAL